MIVFCALRTPALRSVLSEANNYFNAMFTTAMKERNQSEILIKCVDGDILQKLVEFCYTGVIKINSGNISEVTRTATMLQFTKVQEHCIAYYSKVMTASTALEIREIADVYSIMQLKKIAHDFVLEHFMKVFKCEQFLELSVDDLIELLTDDNINVAEEEDVLMALMGWIKYDFVSRKHLLGILLGCIRFQHFDKQVKNTVRNF